MKTITTLLAALLLNGCTVEIFSDQQPNYFEQITKYFHDSRTGLCFLRYNSIIVNVPCTPEVLKLAGAQ